MNIHYQHNAQPLSLMEHPHQTKVVLFESLKAWLEQRWSADVWVDAYQVMRDNDKLNNGLEYLLTALTYDNETVKLDEPLVDLYMVQQLTQVYLDLKGIMIVRLNIMRIMV